MSHGVIFDLDGVLVASGPAHRASWQMLARKHGIQMSDAAFADTFGRPSRDIIRMFWGEQVTDEQIRRYDDEKEALYRELVTGMVPLMIGAREVLSGLAQVNYKLAVGTSGPPENLELFLRETRLAPYFAATVHGFDVKHGKPAPDIFLLCAEKLGLPPARCVVVEDAPVGIEAAIAAGMKAIGLVGTHPAPRLQAAGAARIAPRLADVTPNTVAELLNAN